MSGPSSHRDSQELDEHAWRSSNSPSTDLILNSIWVIASLIGVLSFAILIHLEHFYYPYTLLLITVILSLVVKVFLRHWNGGKRSWHHQLHLSESTHSQILTIFWTLTASLGTAGALFLSYSAVYHCKNPFLLVMLLYLSIDLAHIYRAVFRDAELPAALKLLGFIVALFFTLRYEYRLSPAGIIFPLAAVVVIAAAKLSHQQLYQRDGLRSSSIHIIAYAIIAPILAILVPYELADHGAIALDTGLLTILVINIVASSTAFVIGANLFARLSEGDELAFTDQKAHLAPIMVGVFGILYKILARDFMLPIEQLLAYFLLWWCTSRSQRSSTIITPRIEDLKLYRLSSHTSSETSTQVDEDELQSLVDSADSDSISEGSTSCEQGGDDKTSMWLNRVAIAVGCTAWLLLLLQSMQLFPRFVTPNPIAMLDAQYKADRTLDIVVAYYDESRDEVLTTLKSLLNPTLAESVKPRIIFYNKGEPADEDILRNILTNTTLHSVQIEVENRPNIGRESETYLNHILQNWDSLANHTIFTQAGLHEPAEVKRRMQDVFVNDTGYLSLSYVDSLCKDCGKCKDTSRWQDLPKNIEWIWDLAHPAKVDQPQSQCRNIQLSYNGQFVASARRIRGGGRAIYEQLQDALVNPDSFQHSKEYLDQMFQGDRDRMDQPFFGYTVERMWGVILQCSSTRIADRCPSLLSGQMGMFGALEDYQCLDA